MRTLPGLRTITALAILLVAAFGIFVLARDPAAALAALAAGGTAIFVVTFGGETARATDPATPPQPQADLLEPENVIEAIDDPVLIVADGRVSHANRGARLLLGGHVVGEDVRVAIRHPGAAERLGAPFGAAPQGPIDLVGLGTRDQRWEMRVGRAPGGRRIVHLIDQTGSYAAERMRVDFVANASHELRTPLASILGYIETLDDAAGAEPATRTRFLKVMFDEAQRMQRLVEDLISLSRIEAEKYRLPDAAVDLARLIAEVTDELANLDDADRAIVARIDPGVPMVAGDRVQLSQMLHNLIGNAIKYGRAGTPVTVRLWQDQGGVVRLSVTDQGDGIAPEHIPRLTERFYRVDPGRSRAAGGTGLGLAIVKHIVERHRGRLDIASALGKGTTVTVLVPAHGAAAAGVIKA